MRAPTTTFARLNLADQNGELFDFRGIDVVHAKPKFGGDVHVSLFDMRSEIVVTDPEALTELPNAERVWSGIFAEAEGLELQLEHERLIRLGRFVCADLRPESARAVIDVRQELVTVGAEQGFSFVLNKLWRPHISVATLTKRGQGVYRHEGEVEVVDTDKVPSAAVVAGHTMNAITPARQQRPQYVQRAIAMPAWVLGR